MMNVLDPTTNEVLGNADVDLVEQAKMNPEQPILACTQGWVWSHVHEGDRAFVESQGGRIQLVLIQKEGAR